MIRNDQALDPDRGLFLFDSAYLTIGPSWEQMEALVGRNQFDCRDRWRNHLDNRDTHNQGTWTTAEERELSQVIQQQQIATGVDDPDEVMWGAVAEKMGHKRSRAQCRQKWSVVPLRSSTTLELTDLLDMAL